MAQLSAALLLGLVLTAPVAAAQPANNLVGDWAGKGETLSWNDRFEMSLHIAPDGAGSLVYAGTNHDYRCDVTWTLSHRAARKLEFREKVLTGPCENGAAITLTPNKDGLDYVWTLRLNGKTVKATGKLWRKPVLTS